MREPGAQIKIEVTPVLRGCAYEPAMRGVTAAVEHQFGFAEIGETAARSYLTETGTLKKAIIRKALAGDGRTKVEGWLPRYLQFPQAQYTGRPLTAR